MNYIEELCRRQKGSIEQVLQLHRITVGHNVNKDKDSRRKNS